jgi:hypothetical protein
MREPRKTLNTRKGSCGSFWLIPTETAFRSVSMIFVFLVSFVVVISTEELRQAEPGLRFAQLLMSRLTPFLLPSAMSRSPSPSKSTVRN